MNAEIPYEKKQANKACTRRWGFWRHFQAFFYASAFFQSDGVPPPAPARVTQTVSHFIANNVKT
jgi:hypothetical protein